MSTTSGPRRHEVDGGNGEQRRSMLVRTALTECTPEQEEDSGTVSNGCLTPTGCDLKFSLDSLESPSVVCILLPCGC